MNKPEFAKIFKSVQTSFTKHSPEILTGIGIAGMLTTTVLAVRATPKALRMIEDKKDEQEVNKLTVIDTVKVAWKPYIPAAITGVASATCLIGASSVYVRRTAALAAAYQISETALTEYREQVIETLGEKKDKEVREKVAKKKLENDPVTKNEVIITEKGNTLCYESISGRYFRSDIDKIRRALNELNRQMTYEFSVSLSELYDELGLSHTVVSDDLGWNMDDGLIEVDFSSIIADDGTPCIVLNYAKLPKHKFANFL